MMEKVVEGQPTKQLVFTIKQQATLEMLKMYATVHLDRTFTQFRDNPTDEHLKALQEAQAMLKAGQEVLQGDKLLSMLDRLYTMAPSLWAQELLEA